MLGWLSLQNWIRALTLSLLLELPPRKLEPWFFLWSFFLLRLLFISINLSYAHVWNTVVMSGLVLLVAAWNCWISYSSALAASFEPLAHRRNVVRSSLFYRYYFGRCSSELAKLVPISYSRGSSTRYSDRLHGFSVTIPRCYKDVCVNSFFPRLWNSLPIECFPLTYDISGFKSKINRHLFNCRLFLNRFSVCWNLLVRLFLVAPCLVVAVHGVNLFLYKKKTNVFQTVAA